MGREVRNYTLTLDRLQYVLVRDSAIVLSVCCDGSTLKIVVQQDDTDPQRQMVLEVCPRSASLDTSCERTILGTVKVAGVPWFVFERIETVKPVPVLGTFRCNASM